MTKLGYHRRRPRSLAIWAAMLVPILALAGPTPAVAQSGSSVPGGAVTLGPVPPLTATVNAAAYAPWPAGGAAVTVQTYDDSREHTVMQAALQSTLNARGATAGRPLDLEFEVYVIRSGVPDLAKGILTHQEARLNGDPSGAPPPGIDVTALRGRTAAVEGNVFHQRRESFAAVMRLQATVSDPATGAFVWRGWVDSSLNGLSRAQVAGLLAGPLMESLGQTVARRDLVVVVPESLGGAPAPDDTLGTR